MKMLTTIEVLALSFFLFLFVLISGVLGFHYFTKLDWPLAFQTTTYHMTGMGPTVTLTRPQDQIFAGMYALVSVSVFIGIVIYFVGQIIYSRIYRESEPTE